MRLWKDNRLDAEFEMTPEEIADGFAESEWIKRDDLNTDRALRGYIAEDLHGAWDPFEQEPEYMPVLNLAQGKRRELAT